MIAMRSRRLLTLTRLLPVTLCLVLLGGCQQPEAPHPNANNGDSPETPASNNTENSSPETPDVKREGASPTSSMLFRGLAQRLGQNVLKERLADQLRGLSSGPHTAGTGEAKRIAQQVHRAFVIAGLESRIDDYDVMVPIVELSSVEMLVPAAFRATQREHPLDSDYDTHTASMPPPQIAYSASGDVTGPMVYAYFARPEDFDRINAMGVDLDGAIGIAREGPQPASLQVRAAEEAGLAGLVIYSDPKDFGYLKGDPYPTGAYRPDCAASRLSALPVLQSPGDPWSRGVTATRSTAARAELSQAGLPKIPAATLSAEDARPFLENMTGDTVPPSWQGGHPFTYHLGGDETVVVRLNVVTELRPRKLQNVIATLPGALYPHEWVVVGAGRDAFGHGASTAAGGTAILLEIAAALGALAKEGTVPARSIRFCSFDGTAMGLLGSVEHLDQHETALAERAMMYLDLDHAPWGRRLDITASFGLGNLAAAAVRTAGLYESTGTNNLAIRVQEQFTGGVGNHIPFQSRLGIPVLRIGASQRSPVAHSIYDTFAWLKNQGDPDLRMHQGAALIGAILLFQAASTTVTGFDFAALGKQVAMEAQSLMGDLSPEQKQRFNLATSNLIRGGQELHDARRAFLASDPDPTTLRTLSHTLSHYARSLTVPLEEAEAGAFRSLLVRPATHGSDNVVTLPTLRRSDSYKATEEWNGKVEEFLGALSNLSAGLDRVTAHLRSQLDS